MNQFIKLNLGLIRYILKELPKIKTPAKIVNFFYSAIKIYLKESLKLYKSLFLIFDEDYQKQKKQYKHYQTIKVDLQRALKMLQYIDTKMAKAGMNRTARRQFWRDFYKEGQVRKEVFDDLLKEIGR